MHMNRAMTWLGLLLGVGFVGGTVYKVYQQQKMLDVLAMRLMDEPVQKVKKVEIKEAVAERVVSKSEVWRPIQEKVKDTVVQVFAQVAEFDLLEPFKTPAQGSVYGSAFFINDKGELITNAHVINQAKAIWIQIPSLGKQFIDVELVGMSPDRDLALLRVTKEGYETIRKELGAIPYLPLGDSDSVRRADEVLALGYPLGQQSLKSTSGVISGREHNLIQMSAPINPGSSGGPLLNARGEVIGVNSAMVPDAQNVSYMIPINDLKIILSDLYTIKLLRKPFLGFFYNNSTDSLTDFLGNPQPGGCYVLEVIKGGTLYKAGVQRGDMIYTINGHRLDVFGEMAVPWSEDKVSVVDYVGRLSIGDDVKLVVYRKGQRKDMHVAFSQSEMPPIRRVFPGYEPIDYEVFGGMVFMELTVNHLPLLANSAPGLAKYVELRNQHEPVLVITHIFPNAYVYRSRVLAIGSTISEINGIKVSSLPDFRKALKSGIGSRYITIKASDNVGRVSDHVLVALPAEKIAQEEQRLALDYHYQMSDSSAALVKVALANKEIKSVVPQQKAVAAKIVA
jgi:serine protease Do